MFIFDSEAHIVQSQADISYFPLYKQELDAFKGTSRLRSRLLYGIRETPAEAEDIWSHKDEGDNDADCQIQAMDQAGIHMACVLNEAMSPMTYGARMLSTNGWLVKEVAKYPDRLIGVSNVGPIIARGVKNVVWELEYLVREMGIKAIKFYPPDDTPINNRELWPYYEKIAELDVPLFIHTGINWCVPGPSAYCHPLLLEDVCQDFPTLKIVAFHMGYPWTLELNACAAKYPNLYISTSLLSRFGPGMSKNTQRLLGQALLWAGPDKIIWGVDVICPPRGVRANRHIDEVTWLQKFEISEEVQQEYACPPLTDDVRRKWAGLNLARLLNIKPPTD